MSALPALGTREDERLEFKRAESLRTRQGRRSLLVEIVGMLNHGGGGRILVGVVEEQGALHGLDPLRDDERVLAAHLHDAIVDAIEPRVSEDICRTDWIAAADGWVLEIHIAGRGRRPQPPYCVRDGESRLYKIRVQDRLRTMSFEELLPSKSPRRAAEEAWFPKQWDRIRREWLGEDRRPSLLLVIGAERVAGEQRLPLPETAVDLINRPPERIARAHGWTFQTAFPGSAKWRRGRELLLSGNEELGYRQIRAEATGVLAFRTLLEHLQWDEPSKWSSKHPDAPGMIYPYALVESVVSIVRLGHEIWSSQLPETEIHARLLLTGAKGWLLPPDRPGTVAYLFAEEWHSFPKDELDPLAQRTAGHSFADNPDALAWDLLVQLYQEFDYEPECIPWFDAKERRFQPR